MLDALGVANDQGAWSDFVGRYRPVLIGFGRTWGLRESDAEDVAQQALTEFSRDLRAGKYVRGRGRLRAWLMGIARHCMIDLQRQQVRRKEWRADSVMVESLDDERISAAWDEAQRATILQQALEILRTQTRMSPVTLRAFELAALRGVPTAEVARQCGISEAEVYVAKNRTVAKLREIVEELQDAYTREE